MFVAHHMAGWAAAAMPSLCAGAIVPSAYSPEPRPLDEEWAQLGRIVDATARVLTAKVLRKAVGMTDHAELLANLPPIVDRATALQALTVVDAAHTRMADIAAKLVGAVATASGHYPVAELDAQAAWVTEYVLLYAAVAIDVFGDRAPFGYAISAVTDIVHWAAQAPGLETHEAIGALVDALDQEREETTVGIIEIPPFVLVNTQTGEQKPGEYNTRAEARAALTEIPWRDRSQWAVRGKGWA